MLISLKEAADLLNQGKNVAVPTETVYGLAASLRHTEAIEEIFRLKKRPKINPLIVHVNQLEGLEGEALMLAKAFWPGPLTLVLPIIESIPENVRNSLPACAFRVPSHPITRQLISLTGPLVMPSANLSGRPSSTRPEHVEEDFGSDFPILDGGASKKGVESTILTVSGKGVILLRLGAISREEIGEVIGYLPSLESENAAKPICPGQLFRHYSPNAKLILATAIPPNSVVVGFNDRNYPQCRLFSLGSVKDPNECLKNLYHILRALDQENIPTAFVDVSFPDKGLFATLFERLRRASRG